MVITMAKLCMAHASTHGARKPPGPTRLVMLLLSWMMENELKHTKTSCVEEVMTKKMTQRNNNSEFEAQASKQALMLKLEKSAPLLPILPGEAREQPIVAIVVWGKPGFNRGRNCRGRCSCQSS